MYFYIIELWFLPLCMLLSPIIFMSINALQVDANCTIGMAWLKTLPSLLSNSFAFSQFSVEGCCLIDSILDQIWHFFKAHAGSTTVYRLAYLITWLIVSTDWLVLKMLPHSLSLISLPTELVWGGFLILLMFIIIIIIVWKQVLFSLNRVEILRNILKRVLVRSLRIPIILLLNKTMSRYKSLLHAWNHS